MHAVNAAGALDTHQTTVSFSRRSKMIMFFLSVFSSARSYFFCDGRTFLVPEAMLNVF